VAAPVLLSHPSSLEHDTGPHPERAARIVAIDRELDRRGGLGWERRASSEATLDQLHGVHPPAHVDGIRDLCAAGGGHIDADTLVVEGSWRAALHAAGGAVEAASLVVTGAAPAAFSVHRPPGHHAEATQAMGFCLFNNVAIAAQHARDALGVERVLILDWDVHHGNGTNDIFHTSDEVLFVSIHQSPLYPGTGSMHDAGSGIGGGYTVNLPVPAGAGDDAWTSLVAHVAVPLIREFAPQLVLVSAGFDAHADDPLAGCTVTDGGFATMAALIAGACRESAIPFAGVLEGGYDVDALARSVCEVLDVWGQGSTVAPESVPVHGLSLRAQERLAMGGVWPALGQSAA
jgi:acetoin utilization deacetylase AcuC-like enzyme